MIGMETNSGPPSHADNRLLPEGSRATSPISRRSSTRSTTDIGERHFKHFPSLARSRGAPGNPFTCHRR